MTHHITFISSDINKWPPQISGSKVYLFIDDYITYKKISDLVPDNWVNDSPKGELNLILNEIENELVNLDDLAFSGKFYFSWLASSFAESNPYRSDFLLNVCRIIFLVRKILVNSSAVIVVEDLNFGEALRQICSNRGAKTNWVGEKTQRSYVKYYSVTKTMLSAVYYNLKYRLIYKTKIKKNYSKTQILLLSWVGESHFSPDRLIDKSPYFGSLPSWVREDGSTLTWLANPKNWTDDPKKIAHNIKHAADNVIPLPSLFGFITIIKALARWLFFPLAIKNNIRISGVDISPLIKLEIINEMSSPQIIYASLLSDSAKNLKAAGFNPESLIYNFENQPWEKILITSFRKEFPNISIIANQTAPFADLYLSGFPSQRQWIDGSAPDKLVVVGDRARQRFLDLGAPDNRVFVGGSLRFHHIELNKNTLNRGSDFKTVLVSCPIEAIESLELICKSIEAFKGFGFKILINFHPASDKTLSNKITEKVLNYFGNEQVEFTNKLATELFKVANLFAYSSSGTVFEALQSGISCIHIRPLSRLDLCKLNITNNVSARTVTDIKNTVHKITNSNVQLVSGKRRVDEVFEELTSMIPDFIGPPNKKLWLSLLKSHTD